MRNDAKDFEAKILAFIEKSRLIHCGDRVLVGFSGGADSMSLMQVLAHQRHPLGIRLYAAHFNHHTRKESYQDERFVRHWCDRLSVPLAVGQNPARRIRSLSEDEARAMRFKFFFHTARRLRVQSVALAHTKDDLAETVLMRLIRGSGLYGLRGILPRREIEGVVCIRPLMGVTRREVEAYLNSRKAPFCTDRTNQQTRYLRNKIRLQALPFLAREYNPRISHLLAGLASSVSEDYDYLALAAQKVFKKYGKVLSKKARISLKAFNAQHSAIRRLVIRQAVESLDQDPSGLTFEQIRLIEDCAQSDMTGPVGLPYHLRAQKTKKYLELVLV